MIKSFLVKILFLSSLILYVGLISSQAQKLPTDPEVTVGQLPNGLKYYIKPNAKPENKVELRLVVNAGSTLEDEDQQGLAHFLEHMCFNGTKHFPKNELVDFLQTLGIQFGADLNAYTSFDETVYILPIPTDKEGNLETGFQVLEDWAHNALITDEEIDNERTIVLEESRMRKGADDRMMQKYLPHLLANSRYAERLPIGKDEIIENFQYDAVRRFYRDWYRPDLMAVIAVGDITVEEAKKLIEKHFGHIQNPQNPRERKQFEVHPYANASAMVLTDKEATNYMFQLVHSAKKQSPSITEQDYRNDITRSLFTSIMNQRFQQLTQSATPPFVYAYGYVGGWARGYESFSLYAIPSGEISTAVNAAIQELVRIKQYGFNASELDVAKKRTLSSMEKMYNERNTTESGRYASEYIRNFLAGEPIPGISFEYEIYKKTLPQISLKEVNEEAKKWLADNENFFALVTGPDAKGKKLPMDIELVDMIKTAWTQDVEAKEEKQVATALLDKEPKAGKIIATETDKDLDATTYTLSNGIKVTVKTTDFKSDEIIFNAVKKGGTSTYPAKDKHNYGNVTAIASSMGYGEFSPTELRDFMAGKVVNLQPYISTLTSGFRGSSNVKDFETLLQFLHLQITSPRKDEDLFRGFVSKQKTQTAFLTSNPQYIFFDTLTKLLYNNDERTPVTIPKSEDYDKIDLDRVLEIYKKELGNVDGMHLFIVGNVDKNSIQPLLEKYIASLPITGAVPHFKDDGLRPITGRKIFELKKGEEQQSMILIQYYGEVEYSDDLAFKADYLAEVLNIKVIEELREKLGAIYGGGFNADVSEFPYSNFSVSLYLPCGPENVPVLLSAAEEEIAKILKDGIDEKELNKVKAAKHESHKENLRKNSYWSGRLQSIYFWEKDKERFLNFNKVIDQVTTEDVKTVAEKFFKNTHYFQAVLMPESEVKK